MSDKGGKYKNTKINVTNARYRIQDEADFDKKLADFERQARGQPTKDQQKKLEQYQRAEDEKDLNDYQRYIRALERNEEELGLLSSGLNRDVAERTYDRMTAKGLPEKIGLSKLREEMFDQADIPLYDQLERHSGHPTTKDEEVQQEAQRQAKKKALMDLARNPKIGSKSQT